MSESLFRRFLEERLRKGPILKKLKETFFRAATKVLNVDRFYTSLLDDIRSAKNLIVIISPFLNRFRVEWFINAKEVKEALSKDVKIVVVTRPPNFEEVEDVDEHRRCIGMLKNANIKVATEPKLHFKAVIIDYEIIYLGSINPLSVITVRYIPPDYMVRFESEALVNEIIENAISRDTFNKWVIWYSYLSYFL